MCYADSFHDHKTAIEWYEKALKGGDQDATRSIGNYYFMGKYLPQDYKQSTELYIHYGSNFPFLIDDELLSVYSVWIPELLDMTVNFDTLTSLTSDTAYYSGTIYLTGIRKDPPEGTEEKFAVRLPHIAADKGHASAALCLTTVMKKGSAYPRIQTKPLNYTGWQGTKDTRTGSINCMPNAVLSSP